MKRGGVRTRTLGLGWEERFLAAVRKAREQGQLGPDAAEKLRRLAGAYFCARCKQEHRTGSSLGRQHLRLQPAPAPAPEPTGAKAPPRRRRGPPKGAVPRAQDAALPVELVSKAKAARAPKVGAVLKPRGPRTAARTRAYAKRAAEPALRDATAKAAPKPARGKPSPGRKRR